ncbi:MAG: DUF1549 domain-containing protein [Chthoniobacteraceae bacterium]
MTKAAPGSNQVIIATSIRATAQRISAALAVVCLVAVPSRAEETLHGKIDALIAQAHPEGQAAIAGDAEFLRRVYLALHGVIPTAAQARAFLADAAADKRAKLVDALLVDPQYAKWMAVRFDVMLMERRGEEHTKALPWREWLEESVRANKPWDVLVRELLTADGADEKMRHIARWLLERQADPNALTKDAARLFLGRDIGCSQCHNHPRIDDYLQRDYAGLQAFFSRTYLFRPDAAKPGFVGEQAAGETTYTSVFTKVGGETKPRLTGEAEAVEPTPGEWAVPPNEKDKNVRPIPKESRRALLAAALGDGHHPAFRRNIANRLWALVFGRGLVEPLDLQHSANPPANPALLDLLGEQIAAMKFDTRAFIRELALTAAFQRTLDVPELAPEVTKAAAETMPVLEQEAAALATALAAVEAQVTEVQKATVEVQRAAEPVKAEKTKQDAAAAEAKKIADAAAAERKKSEDALAAKRDVQKTLAEAAAKVNEAVAKAGETPELAAAAKTFQAKADATSGEMPAVEKDAEAKKADMDAKTQALAAAQQNAAAAKAKMDEAAKTIAAQHTALDAIEARKEAERMKAKNAVALAAQVKAAVALASAVAADKPLREAAAKSEAAFAAAKQNSDRLNAEIAAAPAKLAALETAANSCAGEMMVAKEAMAAKGVASSALAEAAAKAAEAVAKLPNDAEVKTATNAVKARADAAAAETVALQKTATDAQAKTETAAKQVADAKTALEKANADLATTQPQLPALETEAKTARAKADETAAPVASAREALAAAWGRSFAANELLALAPEQLCWSVFQATGQIEPHRALAVKEWDEKNKWTDADKADLAKVAAREVGIEKLFRDKIRPHEDQFVRSFGGAAGVPQGDFFATPEQALYFENGSVLRPWAANLANRAAAILEPKAMAEELYLATLTRMPADAEIAELTAMIAARPPEKKAEALTDYAWALITSVEFRFSH